MISPHLHAIWVFLLMNLSQDLKCFLLRYFGTLGDGYSLKGSNKKPSRHSSVKPCCTSLKVHKRETFVGSDFEFCTFLHFAICLNIKVVKEKKFGLAIIQEDFSAHTEYTQN
jgi:hypothetical protein